MAVGRLCGEAVLRGADVYSAGVVCTTGFISEGTEVTLLMDLDMVRRDRPPVPLRSEAYGVMLVGYLCGWVVWCSKKGWARTAAAGARTSRTTGGPPPSLAGAWPRLAGWRCSGRRRVRRRRSEAARGKEGGAVPCLQERGQRLLSALILKPYAGATLCVFAGLAVQVTERLGSEAPPINRLLPGRVYAQVRRRRPPPTYPPAAAVAIAAASCCLTFRLTDGVLCMGWPGQNLPSVVVGHVLRPQPGEVIIDLCAGPGGKTSHLASLMQNQGLLVSCDRS